MILYDGILFKIILRIYKRKSKWHIYPFAWQEIYYLINKQGIKKEIHRYLADGSLYVFYKLIYSYQGFMSTLNARLK